MSRRCQPGSTPPPTPAAATACRRCLLQSSFPARAYDTSVSAWAPSARRGALRAPMVLNRRWKLSQLAAFSHAQDHLKVQTVGGGIGERLGAEGA